MRVAVLAAGSFAIPVLEALAASSHHVAGLISRPDRCQGRRHVLAPCPAAAWADRTCVPVLKPERVSDPEFEAAFRSMGADVAVVADFGEIIRPFVFAWAPRGFFGVHPSLLPRWRGAAPIPWTILAGDSVTGVSIFRLSASIDAGHLALSIETPVNPRDTTPLLEPRLGILGASALLTVLDRVEHCALELTPQTAQGATTARKLDRRDGLLRWEDDAEALDRRVRALLPWPCAWFPSPYGEVKVLRSFPLATAHGYEPGTVLGVDTAGQVDEQGLRVACGRGELVLLELQSPGRRRQPAVAWFRGTCFRCGSMLNSKTDPGGIPA